jgi:hypothetical protein
MRGHYVFNAISSLQYTGSGPNGSNDIIIDISRRRAITKFSERSSHRLHQGCLRATGRILHEVRGQSVSIGTLAGCWIFICSSIAEGLVPCTCNVLEKGMYAIYSTAPEGFNYLEPEVEPQRRRQALKRSEGLDTKPTTSETAKWEQLLYLQA